jgi:hypothetical protein
MFLLIVLGIAIPTLLYCLYRIGQQFINEQAVKKLKGVRSEIVQLVADHNSKHGTDYVYVIFNPSYYDEDTYFTNYGIFKNAELQYARCDDCFTMSRPVLDIKLHSNCRLREALSPRFFLRRMEMVKRGAYPLEKIHERSVIENLAGIARHENEDTKNYTL